MTALSNCATFHDWVLTQTSPEYVLTEVSKEQILLETEYAYAEILLYYDLEIVELKITNRQMDSVDFYLHFQPVNPTHSHELFEELVHSLIANRDHKSVRILLCCSSALTTSFFADALTKTVSTTNLRYTFTATSVDHLFTEGYGYDLILLAPQISYLLPKAKQILYGPEVIAIPPAIFASYDTEAMLDEIAKCIKQHEELPPESPAAFKECVDHNDHVVLVINIRFIQQLILHYRVYDHGNIVLEERVVKYHGTFDRSDLEDILTSTIARGYPIDSLGISTPGMVSDGTISFFRTSLIEQDIRVYFKETYGLQRVILVNNMNAAALGYYYSFEDHKDLLLLYQPYNQLAGGAGLILNGKLYEGFKGMAGETRLLVSSLLEHTQYDFLTYAKQAITAKACPIEEARKIVVRQLVAIQGIVAPERVVLSSLQVNDIEEIKADLSAYMKPEFMPELIQGGDLTDPIFYGTLLDTLGLSEKAE